MSGRSLSNIRQREAARAFVRAGGQEKPGGSGHLVIKMPNGRRLSLPSGILKEGLLRAQIRIAGLTIDEFLELL